MTQILNFSGVFRYHKPYLFLAVNIEIPEITAHNRLHLRWESMKHYFCICVTMMRAVVYVLFFNLI